MFPGGDSFNFYRISLSYKGVASGQVCGLHAELSPKSNSQDCPCQNLFDSQASLSPFPGKRKGIERGHDNPNAGRCRNKNRFSIWLLFFA